MEVAGTSRPCSGAEHLVSHALDELGAASDALHGEKVALGVLVALALQDNPNAHRVRRLFARVGLPPSLAEMGIDEPGLVDALCRAPSTRPGRWTALSEVVTDERAARAVVRSALGEIG
jgi:glycerol-1-phosphate dehydrogenase [NAD(P)+]